MKLVEIINSKKTSSLTLAKAFDFIKLIKKLPIVVNDGPGFLLLGIYEIYYGGHGFTFWGLCCRICRISW